MTENQLKPEKLLIVDDDPDILVSLSQLFKAEGFEVTIAENGVQCLAKLERGFKGIIILDLMMPLMDGIETIEHMVIEGFMEGNRIIVLTAKKIQGEEFNEIYPYIDEFITKPFDINHLIAAVKRLLSNRT